MKTNKTTKSMFLAATLAGLMIPTAFLSSCGQPNDRNAVVNPKIEGKLVVLANISDVTKDSYSVFTTSGSVDTVNAKSSVLISSLGNGVKTEKANSDVNKLIDAVSQENKKVFLKAHLDKGGVVAFAAINGTIRVLAVVDRSEMTTITKNGVKDLTIEDIKDAKDKKIAKIVRVERVRTSEPPKSVRFVEVAAIELEKSGALESEKSDYNETKPTLNIVNPLPVEVSTHAILKGELTDVSRLAEFVVEATVEAKKEGEKK